MAPCLAWGDVLLPVGQVKPVSTSMAVSTSKGAQPVAHASTLSALASNCDPWTSTCSPSCASTWSDGRSTADVSRAVVVISTSCVLTSGGAQPLAVTGHAGDGSTLIGGLPSTETCPCSDVPPTPFPSTLGVSPSTAIYAGETVVATTSTVNKQIKINKCRPKETTVWRETTNGKPKVPKGTCTVPVQR
ncbi:hypothetical protein NDU88_003412 [Pleurodeles waltl]|uniref:Uncharacterized protein n=1 Tax=Pleurodeles waltl TaxID=8319 RepID=A0AAV7M3B6_PLEWA|nr:hypothetical protein NDU88_003412 [Pleurodeles waltl]